MFAVQIARNRIVGGDVVLGVEGVVEGSRLLAVVTFRTAVFPSLLAAKDQRGPAIRFHVLEGVERDRMVDLVGAILPYIKFSPFARSLPHGTEGGIGDYNIELSIRSVIGGIPFCDLEAKTAKGAGSFWIEFVCAC